MMSRRVQGPRTPTRRNHVRGAGRDGSALRRPRWRVWATVVAAASLPLACAPDPDPAPRDARVDHPADDPPTDDGADPPGAARGSGRDTATDRTPDQADDGPTIPEDDSPDDDSGPDLTVDLVATQVASMSEPIAGAVGPDGALYLAERAGTVHQLTEEGLGVPVIDISAQTTTDSERGLLGLAFAPDGNELYLSSTDQDGDTHVLGVTIRDEEIRADEQREIFTIDQPRSNHNGGAIAVGPDGLLYIGLGDGGGAGDPLDVGQDRSSALGSLLRIDPVADAPYRVPDSNPFAGQPDAAPEVFAYGLRNPWRFSFDRATDDLWIADVGQDRREEINRVTLDAASGGNFGWNLMEGTTEFSGPAPEGHIAPVYEYATGGSEGCAVVGGYVYRGAAIEPLVGAYLYADYCVGTVRGLHVDAGGRVIDQAELGIDAGGVLSFAEDGDGEVYVLTVDGGVFRIDQAP